MNNSYLKLPRKMKVTLCVGIRYKYLKKVSAKLPPLYYAKFDVDDERRCEAKNNVEVILTRFFQE